MLKASAAREKATEMAAKISTSDTNGLIDSIESWIESTYLNGEFRLDYDLIKFSHFGRDTFRFPGADLKLVFKHFKKEGYKIRKGFIFRNRLVIKW